uniref:Uncharacterized protein n=1 Tax=Ascaris lumbricoides TaxID=6252 RepID=A0A9J2PJM3_ASCLU
MWLNRSFGNCSFERMFSNVRDAGCCLMEMTAANLRKQTTDQEDCMVKSQGSVSLPMEEK